MNSEPAIAVGRAYDFALWLLPKIEKLPRSYRFTLGERMADGALGLLSCLVEASYSSIKSMELDIASRRLNSLRFLLRLSKDLHYLPADSYERRGCPASS